MNYKKILGILGYIASAAFTVICLWSTASGPIDRTFAVVFAAIMEGGKFTCLFEACNRKTEATLRSICGIAFVVLLFISVACSMCYFCVGEAQTQINSKQNTEKAKASSEMMGIDDNTVKTLTDENIQIRNDANIQIADKKAVVADMPKDWITERKKALQEIDDIKSNADKRIDANKARIDKAKEGKLSLLGAQKDTEIISTNGFKIMSDKVTEWYKAGKITNVSILFIWYVIISFALELVSGIMYVIGSRDDGKIFTKKK